MGELSPIHVLIVIARRDRHYNQVDAVESDKSMMIEIPWESTTEITGGDHLGRSFDKRTHSNCKREERLRIGSQVKHLLFRHVTSGS